MLMKWLKKFFPSSEIKHSNSDIQETLDEAKKTARKADETIKETKIAIIKYSNATEDVAKEIDKNGFARFLKYNKHDNENHQEKGKGQEGE